MKNKLENLETCLQYDGLKLSLIDIDPQGVLCASGSSEDGGGLYGGLGPYGGSAL